MRYFAEYNESGEVVAFGTGYDGIEITKEEYDNLMYRHNRTQTSITSVYNGDLSIENVDDDIRADVQKAVDEMKAVYSDPSREISDSEALDIILGGETA